MKFPHGIIVHKHKTWYSPFDPEYQDETSSLKHYADLRRAHKSGMDYVPKPADGLDYIDKEAIGQVYAAGFIRTMASTDPDGTRCQFEKLPKEERKKRIKTAWRKHAKKFTTQRKTHHRLVFSMSKEMTDALKARGLSPDAVLQSVMKRSLRNFTDRYHRGDSIGYSYGLHHDTDHLHVHVFIHPRTKYGNPVSFSQQLKRRKTDNGQEDKLGFLKKSVEAQVRFWEKKLEDPGERKSLRDHFQPERIFHAPRSKMPQDLTVTPGTPAFRERRELKQSLEAHRNQILALDREIKELKRNWSQQQFKRFFSSVSGFRQGKMEKAFSLFTKEISYSLIREKQLLRCQLHEAYLRKLINLKRNSFKAINPVVFKQIQKVSHESKQSTDLPNQIRAAFAGKHRSRGI